MPRLKKTESASAAKVKKTKKTAPKSSVVKKTPPKKIAPKTRAKQVIVDVIEDDDEIVNNPNFFSDSSLANNIPSSSKAGQESSLDDEEFKLEMEEEELDVQKKFFSDLVSEIKTKQEPIGMGSEELEIKSIKSPKKKISLYAGLVWKFLLMVGILAVIVFYFSFSKLTVLVTPQVEAISDTVFLRVGGDNTSNSNDAREKVNGSVTKLDIEISKTYKSSGEDSLGEEVTGTVILVNNYIKDQPLVATTRLLSGDNKLFRLKNAVTIPAGGKIEAEVYADKVSSDMAISSAHFTIPGLWAGLQDKIYADSAAPFKYQTSIQKYVKASDLQLALRDVDSLILAKAKEGKTVSNQEVVLYEILDSTDAETSAKAGDKVDEFNLTIKAQVVVASFSKDEAQKIAAAKLKLLVPDDKELFEFKSESLNYTLENYDESTKTAAVKASVYGSMILKSNAEIIDREKLISLNAEQIETYLSDYPEIGHYELKFFPSFIERAPHLVDRIEIKIAK